MTSDYCEDLRRLLETKKGEGLFVGQRGKHGQKCFRNHGVLGPASPPSLLSSKDTLSWWQDNKPRCEEKWQAIERKKKQRAAAIRRRRSSCAPELSRSHKVRNAERKWLREVGPWNIGMTFHFPNAYRIVKGIRDQASHGPVFCRFLNRMDRKLYGNAHRRKRLKLERAVIYENSPGVGWHAHVLAYHPDPKSVIETLRDEWQWECLSYVEPVFERRVFDGFVINGDYVGYITELCDNEKAIHDHRASRFR